ncbi:hypothetical protein, conserved [Trypanosoma brucei brucei TREU927]|uniref:Uncharacterized protein n=1 Tax=Trypanosoma brucei brucei (strain 927/4 GUTat10.1) TaxID=185431 RepID=Q38AE6_TRYB2|nr:hypothetical protein, conserved [Trypanosoma brucei brucei TREU927]EAN78224.1 hypothetical protein, conserved [Trypanosoma brucei brucei TREU927]
MSGSRLDARGEKITTFWGIKDQGYDYVSIDLRDNCLQNFEHFGTHPKLLELRLENNMIESFMGLTRQPSLLVIDLEGNPIAAHPLHRVMVLLAVGFSVTTIDGVPVTTQEYDTARAMGYHAALAVSYGWKLEVGVRSQEEYLQIIEACKKARRKSPAQRGTFKTIDHALEERRESVIIRVPPNQTSVENSQCFSTMEYERMTERVKHLEELLYEAKKELKSQQQQQQQHKVDDVEMSRTDSLSAAELRCAHSILFTENIRLTTNVTTSTHEESSGCVQGALMFERASLVFLTFMSRTRLAEFPLCDLQVELHQNVLRIRGNHGSITDVFFGDTRTLRCVHKLIYLRRGCDVPLIFISSEAPENAKLLVDASVNTERGYFVGDNGPNDSFYPERGHGGSSIHANGSLMPYMNSFHYETAASAAGEDKQLPEVTQSALTLTLQDGQTPNTSLIQQSFANTYADIASEREATDETDDKDRSEVSQETLFSTNAVTPRLFSGSPQAVPIDENAFGPDIGAASADNREVAHTEAPAVSTPRDRGPPAVRVLRRQSSVFATQQPTSSRMKANTRTRVTSQTQVSVVSNSLEKDSSVLQDSCTLSLTDAATGVTMLSRPPPGAANSLSSSQLLVSAASDNGRSLVPIVEELVEGNPSVADPPAPSSSTPHVDNRLTPRVLVSRASTSGGRRSPAVRELRQRPLTTADHAPVVRLEVNAGESPVLQDHVPGAPTTTENGTVAPNVEPSGQGATTVEHLNAANVSTVHTSESVAPQQLASRAPTPGGRPPPPLRVPSRYSSVMAGQSPLPNRLSSAAGPRTAPQVPTTRASVPVGRSSPPARVRYKSPTTASGGLASTVHPSEVNGGESPVLQDHVPGAPTTTENETVAPNVEPSGQGATTVEHLNAANVSTVHTSESVAPQQLASRAPTPGGRPPPPLRVPSRYSSVMAGQSPLPNRLSSAAGPRTAPQVPTTRASVPVGRSSPPARVLYRCSPTDAAAAAKAPVPLQQGKSASGAFVGPMPMSSRASTSVERASSTAPILHRSSASGIASDALFAHAPPSTDGTSCQSCSPVATSRRSILSARGSSSTRLSRRWRPTATGDVVAFNHRGAALEGRVASRGSTSMVLGPAARTSSAMRFSRRRPPTAAGTGGSSTGTPQREDMCNPKNSLTAKSERLAGDPSFLSSSVDYKKFLNEPEPDSDTDVSLERLL